MATTEETKTIKAAEKKVAATKVTTSVSDAVKSSVDSVKDARVSGNARAKKILTAFFDDKTNETVTDFVGYIGETTTVCSIAVPADKMNTLYKKLTA